MASVLVAVGLAGCAAFGAPPLDTFELVAPVPASGTSRSRVQLLVAEPSALKSLDGENIVIKPTPATIEYLKGAQWADRLPRIVQSKLVEAYQLSGRLGGVGKPGEGLAIDYQLIMEIRSFEIRLDGPDRADIALHVRLLNDRNGVVRADELFTASVPVSGTGNDAFVAALDRAFGQAASEIVDWSISRM